MQNYKNLLVWQKGHLLTLEVYNITKAFPSHEMYGLTSQLRRASTSIPTNLSEGTGKLTDLDFRRYVSIAFGSSNEVEYLIYLAYNLEYMTEAEFEKLDTLSKEVKKMLSGLIDKLGKQIIAKGLCLSIILIACIDFLT